MERYLPELERLKTSLKLKERAEPPVSHSRNRPADAVQLSASNLPQLDWARSGAPVAAAAAAAAGPGSAMVLGGAAGAAPPMLQVDDLLEVMRGGMSGAVGATPPRGIGGVGPGGVGYGSPGPTDPYALAAAAAAASSAAAAAMELPKYAHTYASAGGSARHALFGSSPPGGGPAQKFISQQLSLPRYPALDTSAAQAAAADLTALSLGQPSAGPSLGPQEVAVGRIGAV